MNETMLIETINQMHIYVSTTLTLLHSDTFYLKHCQKIECVFRLACVLCTCNYADNVLKYGQML